ncbi:hypothetical protein ACWGJP_09345 [Microbacterium sp. NPDC055903]
MSDESTSSPEDGLWSRLRLIEGQPLSARADAYASLHDDLSRRLEAGARLEHREKTTER